MTSTNYSMPLPASDPFLREQAEPSRYPALVTNFGDRHIQALMDWMEGLIPGHTSARIFDSYIIPYATQPFKFFFACGNDTTRVIKLLRHYPHLLGSKICIATVAHSTPTDRARLMKAGYDDVFQPSMSAIEARCRLDAHLRRSEAAKVAVVRRWSPHVTEVDQSLLEPLVETRLTEREKLVLHLLAQRVGRATPIASLQRDMRRKYGHASIPSLRVVVSQIRKKLRQGYTIIATVDGGYVLRPPAIDEREAAVG